MKRADISAITYQLSELIHATRREAGLSKVPVTVGILTETKESQVQKVVAAKSATLTTNGILSLVDWQDNAQRGTASIAGEQVTVCVSRLLK